MRWPKYIQEGMVVKMLWAEVNRTSELQILKRVQEIAANEVHSV
jgi:hypothetical protein